MPLETFRIILSALSTKNIALYTVWNGIGPFLGFSISSLSSSTKAWHRINDIDQLMLLSLVSGRLNRREKESRLPLESVVESRYTEIFHSEA